MTFLQNFLVAAAGIALVLGVWLAVQRAWRACFPSGEGEEDALAGRTDCHRCTCTTPCADKQRGHSTPHTEHTDTEEPHAPARL